MVATRRYNNMRDEKYLRRVSPSESFCAVLLPYSSFIASFVSACAALEMLSKACANEVVMPLELILTNYPRIVVKDIGIAMI